MTYHHTIAGLALAVLLGCSSVAPATEQSLVFRGQHADGSPVALRIFTDKPCTDDRILIHLVHKFGAPQELLAHFKAAVLTWQGKSWSSCWIEQQGYVVSIDEEGAPFQPIPKRLRRVEGT